MTYVPSLTEITFIGIQFGGVTKLLKMCLGGVFRRMADLSNALTHPLKRIPVVQSTGRVYSPTHGARTVVKYLPVYDDAPAETVDVRL